MLAFFYRQLVFGIFSILGYLLFMLWRTVRRQQRENALKRGDSRLDYPQQTSTPYVVELRQTLISMLRGDTDALNRLVRAERARHGDKGEVWHLQKCIRDLERDRRP
jgi:hypothetical protein